MSKKLIVTKFEIAQTGCTVAALVEAGRIIEFRIQKDLGNDILGNIYVGRVQKIVPSIQAAFIDIAPGVSCYYPMEKETTPYFTTVKNNDKLKVGDELLVQVRTEAVKTKAPTVTGDLNLAEQHLVLTTGQKRLGMSGKLSADEKERLREWILPVKRNDCGIVVRTNARDAGKEELLQELEYLYRRLDKILQKGKSRTCYSVIEASAPEFIRILKDIDSRELEEIVTDDSGIQEEIKEYLELFSTDETEKIRFYEDSLLPLHKLYSLESALDNAQKEKVWLKSGGFLVIQRTEAFVAVDVNSGKYQGKKQLAETYRKINLEAAKEIAYQLRLRNLSGIILIDFINMTSSEHQQELMRTLNGYLKQDAVKASVVDITGLQIMEVTRKKVRKSLYEQITEIKKSKEEQV